MITIQRITFHQQFSRIPVTLLLLICSMLSARSEISPWQLGCEYRKNPLGLDTKIPRFSWKLNSAQKNQRQSAYELMVCETPDDLLKGNAPHWSTGKIASSASNQIKYQGKPLQSSTRYYWKVKVYDQNDQTTGWSEPAWFETALLDSSDWKAQWIGDGKKQFLSDADFYNDDPMPLFKKNISITKKILSARLYIAGAGYYEAYLNGKKIGDHVLDPGWTAFGREMLYVTYDITSSLHSSDNVLGIMSGNGWFNPLPIRLFGKFNLRDVQETGRPCVKAQLVLKFADGSTSIIPTDTSWQTAPGPIVRNNVYLGEHYDARLENPTWFSPSAKGWKSAQIVKGPSGRLSAQLAPPVRIRKIITPARIIEAGKGKYLADMGINFAGAVRISVSGPTGSTIILRYGEDTLKDGSLNYLTTVAGQIKEVYHLSGGPGAPITAWQEDRYTLKGRGKEAWSPRFTFHGFRYIEITGWPGIPSTKDIQGLLMSSDLEEQGQFSCSNENFNQLHEVVQRTFLSNVFSVQSDCPGREKMGYGADIVVTAESYLFNYDMANFYRKTIQDFVNDQQEDGGITEMAPFTGIAVKGLGGNSGPLGWQLAFPFLINKIYEFYGDRDIIEQYYPAFVRQMDFIQSKAIDGLFYWDISDHAALDPKPEALTACAFYYHHAQLAAKFASLLGNTKDSVKYTRLARRIKSDIVQKFHIPNTGRFDNGTQSAQLFALWYDLTPDKEKTFQLLLEEFKRHQWHVSTGIYATKMMFDILREYHQPELAFKIATQPDFPGWFNMLNRGATTLWESWEYPDNAPSQNHPMFGSVDEWFYRSVLGINPASPGFSTIRIQPQPAADLKWAKGSYESMYGKIESAWKKEGNVFSLDIKVPVNTMAEVWVPSSGQSSVKENGKSIDLSKEINFTRQENGYSVFSVPSGEYHFTSFK